MHGSLEELQAFVKAYQAVDRLIGEAQVYDEFREEMLKTTFDMSREEFERLTGRYLNVIERIKELTEKEKIEVVDIDVDYELESVKRIEVNYRYLVALLQAHMPEGNDAPKVASEAEDQRISKFIEDYKKNNPKVGEVLSQLWFELKFKPEAFRDKDAFTVIEERVDELIAKEIQDFSTKWGVSFAVLNTYRHIADGCNTAFAVVVCIVAKRGSGYSSAID